MKKFFVTFAAVVFVILCTTLTCFASDINLYINDSLVNTDVAPFVSNERTFVPVRSIFEKLGASVEWNGNTGQVTVKSSEVRIVLTLGSDTAYVNSVPYELDAPPMVVNERTLIPVRFVTEKLGYTVAWNQNDSSVRIYTGDYEQQKPAVQKIDVYEEGELVTVTIHTTESIKPDISHAASPQRFIADYRGADMEIPDGKIKIGTHLAQEVRYAIHDDYTRVVIESPMDVKYDVEYTSNATVIKIMDLNYVPTYKPNGNNIVVIDAGHGGSDMGAIGYDDYGNPVVYESAANLEIARKVRSNLEKAGVTVIMTRTADVRLGPEQMDDLLERSRIANEAGADIFVSIHNNAFSSPEATGTEILYADNEDKIYRGINSYQLAKNVLTPLVRATGLYNRGVKDSPKIVVLKTTTMPSILVEVAFVTNPTDRQVLLNPQKTEEIGKAIADGILTSLTFVKK